MASPKKTKYRKFQRGRNRGSANKNNAIEFLNKLGDPYDDLTKDEFGKHSINFGIYGIPESILIDKDLIIIKKFIGPISKNDYDYIKNIVRK